jgi:DNA-binding winged helix-turn-helix (wHTH) protein
MERLRTLVYQLRRKLEDDPGAPRHLLTESRVGYRFADPKDWFEERKIQTIVLHRNIPPGETRRSGMEG